MQPQLRRWPTPQSVHSWWSDSNPPGATISLHALAKPLSKFLYHRQASGFIAKGADSPLSRETVAILTTYLTFKDIFPATRVLVLTYLGLCAGRTEDDARAIVNGNALACTVELLQSSTPDIQRLACLMLQNINRHEPLREIVAEIGPLRILADIDVRLHKEVIEALASPLSKETVAILATYLTSKNILPLTRRLILDHLALRASMSEKEARAIVDGNALDSTAKLLQSSNPDILNLTCHMLQNIAQYESLRNAVDELGPLRILLDYLSPIIDPRVQKQTIEALASPLSNCSVEAFVAYLGSKDSLPPIKALILDHLRICAGNTEMQARTIVEGNALGWASELLQSGHPELVRLTCEIMINVAQYESFKTIVNNEIGPLLLHFSLSTHTDFGVHRQAIELVACPLSEGTVRILMQFLTSKDMVPSTRGLNRFILEHLRRRARNSRAEARMIADEDALCAIFELLQCSDPEIVNLGCQILRNVAYYESLRNNVYQTGPCDILISLLNHVDLSVQFEAIKALACILSGGSEEFYSSLDGDINVDGIRGPLDTHEKEFQAHVYSILGNIGDDPTFRQTCHDQDLCGSLVVILESIQYISEIWADEEAIMQTQMDVLHVLAFICGGSSAGARAAINAKADAHSLALLKSPSFDVVRLTCMMLGKIASYSIPHLWMHGFDPCMHLVWLLNHESLDVHREAACALECIKASDEGAQSVTAALDWATQLANLDLHHTFLSLVRESRSD
ncbi:armadillo-type protein [Mycena galericulata]|nr:armadillo-type protein [Mycena galericulata]